jgi:DNA adenine methylase
VSRRPNPIPGVPTAPRPVVKWAGGKSRLLDRLLTRLPPGRFAQYAEPFCGGGAMFFALSAEPKRRFEHALLADKNAELVALYTAIKTEVAPLIDRLRAYSDEHLRKSIEKRREHFYAVRALTTDKMDNVERGARLLFLNKTCFNGLWRVNAAGQFNVPFGKYTTPRILDVEGLRAAHDALSSATIVRADFADVTRELERGDFAYFDPPYVPVSKTANFTAYASDRFGIEEQERLASELATLKVRGVKAMLSNAATKETKALYARHGFFADTIGAARAINSDPSKRGNVDELVVTTYRTKDAAPKPVRAPARRKAV